jgi:hypothetical protein
MIEWGGRGVKFFLPQYIFSAQVRRFPFYPQSNRPASGSTMTLNDLKTNPLGYEHEKECLNSKMLANRIIYTKSCTLKL